MFAAAAVALLAVIAGAFWLYRRPRAAQVKVAAVPKAVAQIPAEITLTGTIQPAKIVSVRVPVDGTIDQFLADAGQQVSEGEVLARINNPKLAAAQQAAQLDAEQAQNHLSQMEASLIAARLEVSRSEADAARIKSELERAEKTYASQQTMYREGITPRLVYEKAEQEYNALKTQSQSLAEVAKGAAERVDSITGQLEPARRALAQKTSALEDAQAEMAAGEVNSPADGVVIARRGQPGEPVTPAMADLFQIAVDPTALEVVGAVDAQAASRIRPGQPAAVEIEGVPGTMAGAVREVKAGRVFVEFTSPSAAIKPGMTAQVRIKLS
jgi:HlyD family secretion protein